MSLPRAPGPAGLGPGQVQVGRCCTGILNVSLSRAMP
jgi:hypothetical protein